MSDQTLPDFLFAVITEQRKSVSSLVDALNEAKNGINQLSVSAERSEESRRQVETLLERQSTVESDLKFDLTQCRQQNEILQGQVKTLEENLERTEKLLFVVTGERDGLGEALDQSSTLAATRHREFVEYQNEIATLKLQLAGWVEAEDKRNDRLQHQLAGAIRTNEILSDAYVRLRGIARFDKLPAGAIAHPPTPTSSPKIVHSGLSTSGARSSTAPVVAWMNAEKDMTYLSKYHEDDIPLIVAPNLAAGTLDCAVPTANADLPDDYEVN